MAKDTIMKGFPKVGFYGVDTKDNIGIPDVPHRWMCRKRHYRLHYGEPLVLVAQNERFYRYVRNEGYVYQDVYYIIPFMALVDHMIPVTAIHRWKKSYTILPVVKTSSVVSYEDWEQRGGTVDLPLKECPF